MKYMYTSVLIIMAAAMIIFSRLILKKDKSVIGKAVRNLEVSASVTTSAYAFAILCPFMLGSQIFYGLYYWASDWMLVYMLIYTLHFTGLHKNRRALPAIISSIIGIDGLMMMASAFTGWAFVCTEANDFMGNTFYAVVPDGWVYYIHRAVIFLLVTMILATFIYKIAVIPAVYRGKYLIVLISFITIIIANVLSLFTGFMMDLSLFFYGLLAVGAYYFSAFYVPNGLIESLLAFTAKNMNDCLICYDIDGNCVFANDSTFKLYGSDNPEKFREYYVKMNEKHNIFDKSETSWKTDFQVGFGKRYFETTYKRLLDKKGRIIGGFFIIHDETEEVVKLKTERYRSTHDELTGIFNCTYFYESTAELLETAVNGTYCMIVSDIKDFKLVNDVFGVEKGDEILIKIADKIKSIATEEMTYGRLSGDRFALCLPRKNYNEEAFVKAMDMLGEISGNNNYRVHMHIGVYNIDRNDTDVSVICDRALLAIKSIKTSFNEVVAYYDEKLRANRIGVQNIIGEFPKALRDGQFCIYLQPQTSSADGKVLGGEALVRWIHPNRGMIPPGDFISVFESTGLISRLDEYVWELACKQLRKWKDDGRDDYHISVNISPKDFYFVDVYSIFTKLVEKYDVDPKKLRLEITESAIMTDVKKHIELIDKLREYGFAVEMDDFGSGYSSFNTLKDIYFDTLKIDMGFLRKSENAERSRSIVNSIIILSKQLGMEVITEGVETEEQVNFLKNAGCDIFQGYYFAKPMPVNEFEEKYFV